MLVYGRYCVDQNRCHDDVQAAALGLLITDARQVPLIPAQIERQDRRIVGTPEGDWGSEELRDNEVGRGAGDSSSTALRLALGSFCPRPCPWVSQADK